jgi:hypothetical protein
MSKRASTGATRRPVVRTTLQLDAEAYERMLIHSIKARVSPGELVTRLISEHCRQWSMPGKISARGNTSDRPDPADQASESAPVAA